MANTTDIATLIGKKITRSVKFMGADVEISKLTVKQVLDIQDLTKGQSADDDTAGLDTLKTVIKMALVGGDGLTDDQFSAVPMSELADLAKSIMVYSGMQTDVKEEIGRASCRERV